MDIGTTAIGLVVGLLVGMTGVGGATLLTPILIMVGIHPSVAVGTDLFYNSLTKLFGVVQHYRQKTIDYALVKYLAFGSVPGAVLATLLLGLFTAFYHHEEALIKHALGVVLVLVAIATIGKQLMPDRFGDNRIALLPLERKRGLTIGLGFGLGFLVGLTSIGSGSLFALAMMMLYRVGAGKLVGTDIAHAFLLVTAAGLLQAGFGHVDYRLAFQLLLGSVPGVLAGSSLSARIPARPLRAVMGTLILISGLKLI